MPPNAKSIGLGLAPPTKLGKAAANSPLHSKKSWPPRPPTKKEEAVREAIEGIRAFYNGKFVNFPASVNSATATAAYS